MLSAVGDSLHNYRVAVEAIDENVESMGG